MTAVLSALLLLVLFLGAWTALSVLAAPILVPASRSLSRANARAARGLERRWATTRCHDDRS